MHHIGLFRHNYFPIGLIKELLKCRNASLEFSKLNWINISIIQPAPQKEKSSCNVVTPFQKRGEKKWYSKSLAK